VSLSSSENKYQTTKENQWKMQVDDFTSDPLID
jgi:hypothetical protein